MKKLLSSLRARPKSICILTGAGISAESGVPTFRDSNGLWQNHRVEEVACPEAYERQPALVQRFYNERRRSIQDPAIAPNAAHVAVAKLAKEFNARGSRVFLVTQNVDNLHERAGSTNVCHMHGELLKVRCTSTQQVFTWSDDIRLGVDKCICCQQVNSLRPHIVWFGEVPLEMEKIYAELEKADLFISCGTSGNVYPAAGFARTARSQGAITVEINAEAGSNSTSFDHQIYGRATEVLPPLVDELLLL